MVNISRLTVAYLIATINMKPETLNRRLEPTGLAKPGETRGLTGTGPGLARQESAGRVFGRFRNRTDPFLRSQPVPLARYRDPSLTLLTCATNPLCDLHLRTPQAGERACIRSRGDILCGQAWLGDNRKQCQLCCLDT